MAWSLLKSTDILWVILIMSLIHIQTHMYVNINLLIVRCCVILPYSPYVWVDTHIYYIKVIPSFSFDNLVMEDSEELEHNVCLLCNEDIAQVPKADIVYLQKKGILE